MRRIVALDGLRGIAALCVLFYHAVGPTYGLDGFRGLALAVDFFFVLSGFVVARAYEHRLSDGLTFSGFARLRMKRLYPTIAVGVLIGGLVAVEPFRPSMALAMTIAGLLFVPVLHDHGQGIFPANGPQWSLFFELFANAVHGLLLWRLSLSVIAALWFVSALLAGVGAWHFSYVALGLTGETFAFGFARVLCGYLFGVILFRLGFQGLRWQWPGARLLGELSYPLYAVHYPIIAMVMTFGLSKPAAFACAIGLSLGIAYAVSLCVQLGQKRRVPEGVRPRPRFRPRAS